MRNLYREKYKSNKYKYIFILILLFLTFFFTKKINNNLENKINKSNENSNTINLYEKLLIKSLSRLEYTDDFKFNNFKKPTLFISDTKGNKIFAISLNGKILLKIGSGKKGFKDGDFDNAKFCSPLGMVYDDNILYIADSCNNAIRKIDFNNQEVSTLIKNDEILRNPVDIKFFSDKENLIISCFNKYGLDFYNIKNKDLKPMITKEIGESVEDKNIIKIVKYNNELYFLDKIQNNIYFLSENRNVKEFFKIDFNLIEADSFHIDDTGIYILDKKNSKLFKANLKDKELKLYSGGNCCGNKLENILKTEFNLPNDILAVKDRLYISDANNYRIVEIDKNKDKTSAINIYPDFTSNGLNNLAKYLNYSEFKEKIKFSYDKEGKILLNMNDNFKFLKNAPNSLYIFEQNQNNAVLIKSYSIDEIATKNLIMPKLKKDKVYYIQGTFFYYEEGNISPCLVKNFNRKLIANKENAKNYLNINF